LDRRNVEAILEACLATSDAPVQPELLASAIGEEPWDAESVNRVLEEMAGAWLEAGRGLRLERVGGGWRMVTDPALDPHLRTLHGRTARNRLSTASLEVLAIVAYRQPVTLPEINFVRGVNSASALRTLLDRSLVRVAGRKKVVGQPFLYRTTREFLVHFGLDRIQDLPSPEELGIGPLPDGPVGSPDEGTAGSVST